MDDLDRELDYMDYGGSQTGFVKKINNNVHQLYKLMKIFAIFVTISIVAIIILLIILLK